MNVNKITINFLRSLTHPNPRRDWFIILICAGTLSVYLVATAIYFFFGIASGDIISPRADSTSQTISVSRESLQDVVSQYEQRRINYEAGNVRTAETISAFE